MYFEQVTAAAYEALAELVAGYEHTYRPDTEQLVLWTNVHDYSLIRKVQIVCSKYDTDHVILGA